MLWDLQQKMLDGRMWSVCNVGPPVCSVEQTEDADWDDMVRQIVWCTVVQTLMNSDDQLERDVVCRRMMYDWKQRCEWSRCHNRNLKIVLLKALSNVT